MQSSSEKRYVHILKKRFKIYHIYGIKNPRSNHWQNYVFFWNNFGTLWHGQTCAAQLIYIYILFLDDRLMEVHSWPEPSFDCLYRKKKIFKTHIFNKHMPSAIISGCDYVWIFWAKRLGQILWKLIWFFLILRLSISISKEYNADYISQSGSKEWRVLKGAGLRTELLRFPEILALISVLKPLALLFFTYKYLPILLNNTQGGR